MSNRYVKLEDIQEAMERNSFGIDLNKGIVATCYTDGLKSDIENLPTIEQEDCPPEFSKALADNFEECLATDKIEQEPFKVDQNTSDGYHTFKELYYHRMVLFSVICNQNESRAWKSRLHDDGTMYDNYFIVGLKTPDGQYTYHYHMDNWDMFDVIEYNKAPKWDGHKPEDITRLKALKELDK